MIAAFTQTLLITLNSLSAGGFKCAVNAFTPAAPGSAALEGSYSAQPTTAHLASVQEKRVEESDQKTNSATADRQQSKETILSERGVWAFAKLGTHLWSLTFIEGNKAYD